MIEIDLQKHLVLPSHIGETNLCHDIVLWSDTTKRVVLIELTVPWEEKIKEAREREGNIKSMCMKIVKAKDGLPGANLLNLGFEALYKTVSVENVRPSRGARQSEYWKSLWYLYIVPLRSMLTTLSCMHACISVLISLPQC